MRVSFDVGGVLSKYPHVFRRLMHALHHAGVDVHVITDIPKHDEVLVMLADNGFGFVPATQVHCADYAKHGERCKTVLIEQLGIDLHVDDFPGYCAGGGLQLFVWPNPDEPYWHDDWIAEGDFGRRRPSRDAPPMSLHDEFQAAEKEIEGWPEWKKALREEALAEERSEQPATMPYQWTNCDVEIGHCACGAAHYVDEARHNERVHYMKGRRLEDGSVLVERRKR